MKADDLPRETAVRLDALSRHGALLELVEAKDRILMQMLKEREALTKDRDDCIRGADLAHEETEAARAELAMLRRDREALVSRVSAHSMYDVKKKKKPVG